jgi:NAD(P)-dependent dehydrogenase (short-subunit alcohol dehydrogenase family)
MVGNEKRFGGRVAVVSGAGQGIGRAIVMRLASEGASVVVGDRVSDAADRVVDEVRSAGGTAVSAVGDARAYEAAEQAVDIALDEFGQLDVLVNNAGGTIHIKPFWEYSYDEIRAEVDQSLLPTLFGCRAALVPMMRQRHGSIVNIGSAYFGALYRVPYASSKGGVVALTESLAREVGRFGIRVNCVKPGRTAVSDRLTPRAFDVDPTDSDRRWQQDAHQVIDALQVLERDGTPEDLAAAVAFLASDEAGYATGQTIAVAGGLV